LWIPGGAPINTSASAAKAPPAKIVVSGSPEPSPPNAATIGPRPSSASLLGAAALMPPDDADDPGSAPSSPSIPMPRRPRPAVTATGPSLGISSFGAPIPGGGNGQSQPPGGPSPSRPPSPLGV